MNKFGDLLNHEFVSMMNGLKIPTNRTRRGITYIEPANVNIPESFDWRDEGKFWNFEAFVILLTKMHIDLPLSLHIQVLWQKSKTRDSVAAAGHSQLLGLLRGLISEQQAGNSTKSVSQIRIDTFETDSVLIYAVR